MNDREQDLEQQDESADGGARGGSDSPSADRLPPAPSDDDTPLGDTDQHSDVPSDA
jgi:hypothetical protein